jgi:hypothetical protein
MMSGGGGMGSVTRPHSSRAFIDTWTQGDTHVCAYLAGLCHHDIDDMYITIAPEVFYTEVIECDTQCDTV